MFSKLKRFPTEKHEGPPVGAYDPKLPTRALGPVTFKRSPRERNIKVEGPCVGQYDPRFPTGFGKGAAWGAHKSSKESLRKNVLNPTQDRVIVNLRIKAKKRRSQSVDYLNLGATNADFRSQACFHQTSEQDLISLKSNCDESSIAFLQTSNFGGSADFSQQTDFNVEERVSSSNLNLAVRLNEYLVQLQEIKVDRDNIKRDVDSIFPNLQNHIGRFIQCSMETKDLNENFQSLLVAHSSLKESFNSILAALDERNSECSDLRYDAEVLRCNVLPQMNDEIQMLNNLSQKKDQELAIERHLIQEKETELRLLQIQLCEAQNVNEFWSTAKEEFDRILIEADECASSLTDENERLKSQLAVIHSLKSFTVSKISFLKENCASCEREIENFKSETISAFDCAKDVVDKFAVFYRNRLDNEISKLNAEIERLSTLVREANDVVAVEKNKVVILEDLALITRENAKQLNEVLDKSKTDFQLIQDENDGLRKEVKENEKRIECLIAEKVIEQTERSNLIDQALQLCDDNDMLRQQNYHLECSLKESELSNDIFIVKVRDELAEVSSHLRTLNESHVELCKRFESLDVKQNENAQAKEFELKKENERLTDENSKLIEEVSNLKCLNENILSEVTKSCAECERYKDLYDKLHEKIEPFKEQLDLYQSERNVLNLRENESEETLRALMEKYAALLSHQNQKQKIHHIQKLKDDCLQFRQESRNMLKENAKLKTVVDSLQRQLDKFEDKNKFDPSKAFSHQEKENRSLKVTNENCV